MEKSTDDIRITLPERFTFASHREFRGGYSEISKPSAIYQVDCSRTAFIDSAGLGMLMQLAEHAGNNPKRLQLLHCRREILDILQVAGICERATIV